MLGKIATAIFVTGFLSMEVMAQDFDVQGHRGARGLAPENTLAAFARALTIGVSTLELDVGVSREGTVIVTHNPRLEPDITRRSDGTWLTATGPAIRTLSLEEIRSFNVGQTKPGSR
ncbi:MAG: glycerophosphodiester phosphodiesterase family protein [Rhodospirillales bacterium]|jgi:glycerophosphoryl diester phosphodiesterase